MKSLTLVVVSLALIAAAQGSVKDDALKYLNSLILQFNQTADGDKSNFLAYETQLITNFNQSREDNRESNYKTYLSYNDKAYVDNCEQNVFWAFNGVRQEVDEWFDTCVGIESLVAQFQGFLNKIDASIEGNKDSVSGALVYVASCQDDDPNLDDCVANGTLQFLTVLNAESHQLNIDQDRVASFESELEGTFPTCETSVSSQAVEAFEGYLAQYCTPPTTQPPTTQPPTTQPPTTQPPTTTSTEPTTTPAS